MQIDIISDTICPWCYIGRRKLEEALRQRPGMEVDLAWRPFQLNPHMASEGMDRATYLATKFGGAERAQQIYRSIAESGSRVGIDFRFDRILRTPSTVDSHRLIRWAKSGGHQEQVVELLFQKYFIDGADIGNFHVLVEIAKEVGMDTELVGDLLQKDADVELVRHEDNMARQMGINGVPCFVIDRKYAISGAQDAPVFLKVFDLANTETVAAEALPMGADD